MNPFRLGRWAPVTQDEPNDAAYSGTSNGQLDSDLSGVSFNATIKATWRSLRQGHDAIVFHGLRQHASAVTRGYSVLDSAAAEDALNAYFATAQLPAGTTIRVLRAHATLDVADDVRRLVEQRVKRERETAARMAGLEDTHSYLMRWRERFLCDPATAMLWWADGDRDRFLKLADQEQQFETVVNLVGGRPGTVTEDSEIAPLVASFLADLDADDRTYLIKQLGSIFENYRRSDLAEKLRKFESCDMPQDDDVRGRGGVLGS